MQTVSMLLVGNAAEAKRPPIVGTMGGGQRRVQYCKTSFSSSLQIFLFLWRLTALYVVFNCSTLTATVFALFDVSINLLLLLFFVRVIFELH